MTLLPKMGRLETWASRSLTAHPIKLTGTASQQCLGFIYVLLLLILTEVRGSVQATTTIFASRRLCGDFHFWSADITFPIRSQHVTILMGGDSESLDLAEPHLLEELIRDLSLRLAADSCRIASVNLHGRDMNSASCAALAGALARNRSVTSLDISSSGFNHMEMIGLFAALESNTTLARLDAADNGFDSAGIEMLARMLRSNRALTELNLSSQLCDASADEAATEALASALVARGSVMRLTLSRESFPGWECDSRTALHDAAASMGGRLRLIWLH